MYLISRSKSPRSYGSGGFLLDCTPCPTPTRAGCKFFGPYGTETFSVQVNLPWDQSDEVHMQLPSVGDVFLASAITGVALLTEIGVFVVLGLI